MTYRFDLAVSPHDIEHYFKLRRSIFCAEQALFAHSDEDEIDRAAYPIVAIDAQAQQIVGVVRIYEVEPGIWYGGRLGTHPSYRKGWQIGKGLIYKAVTTANGWGCQQFLATVQLPNVRFFERLHWRSLEQMMVCDRPHHLMQADLDFYPPSLEARPVLSHLEAVS